MMVCPQNARTLRRPGFTLVELLIVLAILGMLMGLVGVALMEARGASRRTQCASNLRQIGIAMNVYAARYGSLPPGQGAMGHSLLVAILPELDQKPLYDAINFQRSSLSPPKKDGVLVSTSLNILSCPSDGVERHETAFGSTNYAGNRGSGVQKYGYNGVFGITESYGYQHIRDGAAQTALMSEWVQGPANLRTRDARRSVFLTPYSLLGSDELDLFAELCMRIDQRNATLSPAIKGNGWMYGEFGYSLYNHTIPPNGMSCTNGTAVQEGAWTAGSYHRRGAHTVFVDGHISFIRDSIHTTVWRAIGSRDGGEIVAGY